MLYLLLKTMHLLAVVVFVGNIITGAMWKFHADRSGDPRLMAHALAGLIRSDRWFTQPAVAILLASGIALTMLGGYSPLATTWIVGGIALFAVSGIVFMAWVAPAQKRLLAIASAPQFHAAAYERTSRLWVMSGSVALLAPLGALALMVFKPVLQ